LHRGDVQVSPERRFSLQKRARRTDTIGIEVNMRFFAGFLALAAMSLAAAPAGAQGATAAQPQTIIGGTATSTSRAQISGRVLNPGGSPIANTAIRARNLLNGEVGGSAMTTATGQFSINVVPGSYVIEVVDTTGQIVGTSPFISAAAGSAAATTITVTTGALSTVTTTSGLLSTLGTTAARSVTYAAAAAGVAGVVTPANVTTASPSR
jgi:hypothetical protein